MLTDDETGAEVLGVRVTCGKCGKFTESFGTGSSSIKRCLSLLREDCNEFEINYYECEKY